MISIYRKQQSGFLQASEACSSLQSGAGLLKQSVFSVRLFDCTHHHFRKHSGAGIRQVIIVAVVDIF